MPRREETIRWLEKHLKPSRYRHVMGVLKVAGTLAKRHGESVPKAELAALFHDYAKNFSDEEMAAFVEKEGLADSELDACRSVNLYHGAVGAFIAEKTYGVRDPDVLNAIRNHTFGRAGMSRLEKIIYLADLIEPSRSFKGVEHLRRLALEDLDRAMLSALNRTLIHLIDKGARIQGRSVEARNEMLERLKE